MRPKGMREKMRSCHSGSSRMLRVGSVSTNVGPTAFTVIPYCASSIASTFVRSTTPPLLAPYADRSSMPTTPTCEAMLIMRPPSPRATMCRAAACAAKKLPLRFVSSTLSQLASSTSNTLCGMFSPALLTKRSKRPNSEATRSTPVCTEDTSVTSITTGTVPNRSATCAADFCSRLVPTTVAPASLRPSAIPAPKPLLAPVTKATCPSSRNDKFMELLPHLPRPLKHEPNRERYQQHAQEKDRVLLPLLETT